jgi:hypothetical protein
MAKSAVTYCHSATSSLRLRHDQRLPDRALTPHRVVDFATRQIIFFEKE